DCAVHHLPPDRGRFDPSRSELSVDVDARVGPVAFAPRSANHTPPLSPANATDPASLAFTFKTTFDWAVTPFPPMLLLAFRFTSRTVTLASISLTADPAAELDPVTLDPDEPRTAYTSTRSPACRMPVSPSLVVTGTEIALWLGASSDMRPPPLVNSLSVIC